VAIRADVSRKAEVDEMFAALDREFGRLDVLVNNAGIFFHAKFEDLAEEQWDHILAVNLKSQMLCAQAAARIMRRNKCTDGNRAVSGESAGPKESSSGGTVKGRIINMASLGGLLPWPGYTHYCVSKAGVIMLTRCLARALAPEILVNTIAPGTIQFPDESPHDAHIEEYIRRVPLHRTGSGDDIAETVVFLAHADFITGQILAVDGGRTLV
jgi:NAD(P)-dependent dehydrogenase (short-subunit alcohol dehydrogenase family)